MRKVYLITGGAYSDYTIYGAYSDLETAKRAAFALHLDVEERDLDPPVDYPPGMRAYHVTILVPGHPDRARYGVAIVTEVHEAPPDGPTKWLDYPNRERSQEDATVWAASREEAAAMAAHRGYQGPPPEPPEARPTHRGPGGRLVWWKE